jgi:hypothetical protein
MKAYLQQDAANNIELFGEDVEIGGITLKAFFLPNAQNPPPYGYENMISGRAAEFTFSTSGLEKAGVSITRGTVITVSGINYKVSYLSPSSGFILTIFAEP